MTDDIDFELEDNDEHISVTQINMFLRCPQQWCYRYLMGIKEPSNHMLALGGGYHKAIETNFRQKIATRIDLPLADVLDAFSTAYDNIVVEEELSPDGDTKDMGIAITSLYHQKEAPNLQPKLVEAKFTLGYKVPLKGVIDLVDEEGIIWDHKTKGKAMTQEEADNSLQLSAYAKAYRDSFHKPEAGLVFDVAVKTKKPYIAKVKTSRTEEDLEWFDMLVNKVTQAIKSGIFYPNPSNPWLCSMKWCGYYSRCRGKK